MFGLFSRTKNYEEISASEAAQRIENDKSLGILDVRTQGEFRSGYIPKAIHADISSSSFMQKIEQLDKSKTWLVYCLSGGRSARACSVMAEHGFKTINMRGGISSWSGKVVK